MKVVHRVTFDAQNDRVDRLSQLGISLNDTSFINFEMSEDDENWPIVAPLIDAWDAVDIFWTTFDSDEIEAASRLQVQSKWNPGYPEPSSNFEYLEYTYDGRSCESCKIGLVQVQPFRIWKAPKWGRRRIFQLHWILDELFVESDFFERVFRPHGIASREVYNKAGTKVLESVVQVVISERVDIETADLVRNDCRQCGQLRYHFPLRGEFPAIEGSMIGHIARTEACFGDRLVASNMIIVSDRLYDSIAKEDGLRALSFRPVSDGIVAEHPENLRTPS